MGNQSSKSANLKLPYPCLSRQACNYLFRALSGRNADIHLRAMVLNWFSSLAPVGAVIAKIVSAVVAAPAQATAAAGSATTAASSATTAASSAAYAGASAAAAATSATSAATSAGAAATSAGAAATSAGTASYSGWIAGASAVFAAISAGISTGVTIVNASLFQAEQPPAADDHEDEDATEGREV